ncbi:MAG TPA: hypothetical protein VKX17_20580 [Planctomycetota bacterium]|nr:hypothetical protein [Planctomycetota bacterium]
MASARTKDTSSVEHALIAIVRKLPAHRTRKILTFARQVQRETESPENEADIVADEKQWDKQFRATKSGLKKMAEKVRAEIRDGKSRPMIFTDDGRIAPDEIPHRS